MTNAPADAFDPTDLDGLEREVRKIQEALDETTSTAESDDGLIEATVNGRGHLTELRLDARIYRSQDSEALAKDILDATRRAAEQAQVEVVETAGRRLLPPDLPAELVDAEFDPIFRHVVRLKGREG